MKSQQEDGLRSHSKEMACEVTARRWFVKSQKGNGL